MRIAVHALFLVSLSLHVDAMTNLVGVITRAVAVIADAIVLGLTLWKTLFIFRVEKEARAATKLTTTLAYNGMIYLFVISYR